jgi:hypothetical protein
MLLVLSRSLRSTSEMDAVALAGYWRVLQEYPRPVVQHACDRALKERTWLPPPAELVDLMDGYEPSGRDVDWQRARREARERDLAQHYEDPWADDWRRDVDRIERDWRSDREDTRAQQRLEALTAHYAAISGNTTPEKIPRLYCSVIATGIFRSWRRRRLPQQETL